jgi:uncharacterized protein YjdB
LVVALGVGACSGGSDTTAVKFVATPQPAAIRLDSSSITVTVGADHKLVATVTDASGAVINAAPVSWNSINPTVVSVSQDGVVHGVAVGTAQITAVSGPRLTLATVTVVAAASHNRGIPKPSLAAAARRATPEPAARSEFF